MKIRTIILTFTALTLAVVVSAVAIHRQTFNKPAAHQSAEQTFDVKGRVVSIEPGGKTVHIAHEEIPDFMPAMTMPFTIQHPEQVADLSPGDSVKFRLVVSKDDSWVSTIDKDASAKRTTAVAERRALPDNRVETGEAVPDFDLVDQNEAPVKLSQFRGEAVLVTFIYTRCPLPNFCPLMSNRFSELQGRLAKKFPGKFHLISVSFDPEFDTPAVMKDYGKRFGARQKTWTLATGSQKQVDNVAGLFGLIKEKGANGYDHDLRTALISPEGKLVHIWRSNVWTAEEVQARVAEVLGE